MTQQAVEMLSRMFRHVRILSLLVCVLWISLTHASNIEDAVWISATNEVATALGLTHITCDTNGVLLSNACHAVHMVPGKRNVTVDGVSVWFHVPPHDLASNDLCHMPRVDFESMLKPILLSTQAPMAHLCIVLDPGHGGDDTGARSPESATLEKHVALDIAQRTAAHLQAAGQEVHLTRTNDVYITLGDRTHIAANLHAQVFVSIHANFTPFNSFASGVETYAMTAPGYPGTAENSQNTSESFSGNGFDALNAVLGYAIQRRCLPFASMDRGLKRARYHVLREASCPAVLVECGFLSNTNDTAHLSSEAFREQLAGAIANGILDYAQLALPVDTHAATPIVRITSSPTTNATASAATPITNAVPQAESTTIISPVTNSHAAIPTTNNPEGNARE